MVILNQQEKVKNEMFSSKTIKVLACTEVDFNFLENFTCIDNFFAQ